MSKTSKYDGTAVGDDLSEWDANILQLSGRRSRSSSVDFLREGARYNTTHATPSPSHVAMVTLPGHCQRGVVCVQNRPPNPTFARSFHYGCEVGRRGGHNRASRGPRAVTWSSDGDEQLDGKPAQRTAVVQCSPAVRDMSVQTHRGHLDVVPDRTRSRDRGVQASTNEAADYEELLSLIKGMGGAVVREVLPAGAADCIPDGLLQQIADRLTELLTLLHNVKKTTDQVTIKEDEVMSAVRTLQLVGCSGDRAEIPQEFYLKIARLLEQILGAIKECATVHDVSKLFALIAELNNTSVQLRVDCQAIMKIISSVGKSSGFEEKYFVKITTYFQEILQLLHPVQVKEARNQRQLFEGPCRCAQIGDASTAIYRAQSQPIPPSLCQWCTNNFKGQSFVQSLDLPTALTEDIINILGKSIECIERDDVVNLELQLKKCKQKVGKRWDRKDYAITYEALFHLALLWRSKQTAVCLTGHIDVGMMVKGMQDEKHRYRLPDYIQKAIKSRNLDAIKQICMGMKDNDAVTVINAPLLKDNANKYALFEAARAGDLEIFKYFIKLGAKLDVKEGDKTILHELAWISKQKLESPKLKEWNQVIVSMFGTIHDQAGWWWERDMLHAKWTGCTEASRINALMYLCSIQDSRGLNAIQFAARHATPEVIHKIVCNSPYEFIPDPMEFGHENGLKGYVVDEIESRLAGKDRSVLECMLLRHPADGARVMSIEPFKSIIDDKWQHYRVFYCVWFMLYLIYMSIYSACAIHRPIGVTTFTEMYQTSADYARLVGEILILIVLPLFFYGEIRDGVRIGFVAPRPWLRSGVFRILNLLFAVLIIVVLIMRVTITSNEEIPLSLSLVLGWVLALEFIGAWKRIGMFVIIMHKVITIDIALKFFLVWLILLAGTSTATFVAYQQNIAQINTNFPNNSFWSTPLSLIKVSFALLDADYASEATHPALGILLWILFIFLFNFTLFGLLIGMVADTYARTRARVNTSWIWVRANYALLMDRRLPGFLCIGYTDNQQTGFTTTTSTRLRYLTYFRKRRARAGNVVTVKEHVVLIANVDEPDVVKC